MKKYGYALEYAFDSFKGGIGIVLSSYDEGAPLFLHLFIFQTPIFNKPHNQLFFGIVLLGILLSL